MKTTIEDSGDYVRVIVFDVDPALAPQMAGFEFTPIERGFERRFEAGPQDLPVIVARFQDSIEEMVMQLAGRKPTPWQAALRQFVTIAGTEIDWWLVGSTALAVRGIPIDPKDVDIVVPEEAFDRTNGLFNDFIVEPPRESSEFIARFFARAFMDARVEWVAGSMTGRTHQTQVILGRSRLARAKWSIGKESWSKFPPCSCSSTPLADGVFMIGSGS